ncbi:MAG TPA: hypothetical protein PK297_04535 [Spirochaetota bacterium]|nr:hypothetical protein [Spirochaetota bacterium]
MSLPHERFKAHGELSPLSTHLFSMTKILLVMLLVTISTRTVSSSGSIATISRIETRQNSLVRSRLTSAADPAWPSSAPLHALWPDTITYFNKNLDLLHAARFSTNEFFTSDRWGYATYTKTGNTIEVFNTNGEKISTHNAQAWPRATGSSKWLLLYTGDQSGLAALERASGTLVAPYQQLASLVTATAINEQEQSIVFGMVDGSLEKFSLRDTKTIWRQHPPEGRLSAIKGLTIQSGDSSILVVSGSRPETFSRYSNSGKLLWSTPTGGDLRTQVMVHAGYRYTASQTAAGLILYDLDSGSIVRRLEPNLPSGKRVTWTSFQETKTGEILASISSGSFSAIYHLGPDLAIRNVSFVYSPWMECTLADNATQVVALAGQNGIEICRSLEIAPCLP